MFEEGVQNKNLDEFLGVCALENMGELVNPGPYHLLEFIFRSRYFDIRAFFISHPLVIQRLIGANSNRR